MSDQILQQQLAAWERKPGIRRLYRGWFETIRRELLAGPTIEVGAGIGKFKEQVPDAITMDIGKTPWTDMVGDAQYLPVRNGTLANIVLFDVLHHLPRPALFFGEALRALKSGGRVLIMDPYLSPLSYPVYRWLHQEGADLACDPLGEDKVCSDIPFDSNQAVATILFFRRPDRFACAFKSFRVVRRERLSLLAYPLSGGFSRRAWLSDSFLSRLADFESRLSFLAPFCAFRTFIVLEKI